MRRRKARPWDRVVLPVHFWSGMEPEPGDTLETTTGRHYLITRLRLSRPVVRDGIVRTRIAALECVVLPDDEAVTGTIHQWRWSPRARRK